MSEAVAVKERANIPRVGVSLDRRALQNVGEVLKPQRVSVLMCFVCGCKHIHYSGFDMFGNPCQKGKIHFQNNSQWLRKMFTENKRDQPHVSVGYDEFQKMY